MYDYMVTETELLQAAQLRASFPGWVIFTDSYGFTGRRIRMDGCEESYGPLPALVIRSHLDNAVFGDVLAKVLAGSA